MSHNQEKTIARAAKAIKWAGAGLFLACNAYMLYRFATAYGDGKDRGEVLHREREARKKNKKTEEKKGVVPEEVQPEYVEKQVRKYKNLLAQDRAKTERTPA